MDACQQLEPDCVDGSFFVLLKAFSERIERAVNSVDLFDLASILSRTIYGCTRSLN